MYKTASILMLLIAIFSSVTSMLISDPVESAIKGLESTLYFLAALALFVVDEHKRGDK